MKKAIIIVLAIVTLMFAEYRFIMHRQIPYKGDNGTVYIEMFGHVDTYYAESMDAMYK